jgi:hypothetical protein
MLESRHMTYSVLVQHKPPPPKKNQKKTENTEKENSFLTVQVFTFFLVSKDTPMSPHKPVDCILVKMIINAQFSIEFLKRIHCVY